MDVIVHEDLSDLCIDVVMRAMVRQPTPIEHSELAIEYLSGVLHQLVGRNADERRGLYLKLLRNLRVLSNFLIGLNRGRNLYLMEDVLKGEHRALQGIGNIIIFDVSMRKADEKRHILAFENSLRYAEDVFRYLSEEDPIQDRFSELYSDFARSISSPVALLRETKSEISQFAPRLLS